MKSIILTRREALLGLLSAGAVRAAAAAADGTSEVLKFGASAVEVEISDGAFDLERAAIIEWIRKAATAVTAFYGHFPVPVARMEVQIVEGRSSVFNGVTYGRSPGNSTLTRISVGQHITQRGLDADWVATHELVHLAFPSVPRRNHWIEEGLSTYVEPLARLHLKQITEDVFWRDMIRDMPQGLPAEGDRGMDNTHTWGRTYWGGAIFCLQADVAIRERTHNRSGLQQALRGILDMVGSIQEDAELAPVLAAGDKATGTSVLMDLYGRVKDLPEPANLQELWKSLGVSWERGAGGGRVGYDDRARLAATRRAIVTPTKS